MKSETTVQATSVLSQNDKQKARRIAIKGFWRNMIQQIFFAALLVFVASVLTAIGEEDPNNILIANQNGEEFNQRFSLEDRQFLSRFFEETSYFNQETCEFESRNPENYTLSTSEVLQIMSIIWVVIMIFIIINCYKTARRDYKSALQRYAQYSD